MGQLFDLAAALSTMPQHVRVLADIGDGWDGTSNGAIMSLVVKGQAAAGVLLLLAYCIRVWEAYFEKSGGGGPPGPGGGGGGGNRGKKIMDETKYFGYATVGIAMAYPIALFFTNLAGGAL